MKRQKSVKYSSVAASGLELKEAISASDLESGAMVRTQIYLSKREHDFLQAEARRRDEPMAAVIRGFIDEKMEIPDEAWTNNPMLQAAPGRAEGPGHEDGGLNHDHYVYGAPKKWIKVKGKYVEAPPLPEDYYVNRASADVYDRKIKAMDETR